MKYVFLFLVSLTIITNVQSQLSKGNWIVGGSGSFSSYNRDFQTPGYAVLYKSTDVTISPSIAYFLIDKLALGFRPSYILQKSEDRGSTGSNSGGTSNFRSFEVGAFGRWYFLNKGNNYNFLSDVSYNHGFFSNFGSNTGRSNSLKFLTGPAIYFNSSVGIELLLGYSASKTLNKNGTSNLNRGFLTTLGFQIHLEKDN
jgi:hypothetical protein